MPGGSPVAVHVNGALPPELTFTAREHDAPIVQSEKDPPYGAIAASVGDTPMTTIDTTLLYEAKVTLSVTVIIGVYFAGPALTRPEIVPSAAIERPPGN